MRLLSWLATLTFLLLALDFTVKNSGDITLSFWPFDAVATMPIALLTLGLLFIGFVLGSATTWFSTLRYRFEARRLRKELVNLEKKIENSLAQAQHAPEETPISQPDHKRKIPWLT